MTEPIAVDVPGKPAFPRSAPSPAPAAVLPAPRADSPAKPEAPKATAAPAPATKPPLTPPPVAAPSPLPPTAKPTGGFLARFTRKQITIGATAIFSVVAGIGGVRLLFPSDDAKMSASVASGAEEQWAGGNRTAPTSAPIAPPTVTKDPAVLPVSGGDTLPPIPTTPPSTAKPTNITPVSPYLPPTVVPEAPKMPAGTPPALLPPPSGVELPPIPLVGVTPAGGTEPPKTPPTGVPLPTTPVMPPSGTAPTLPPLPAVPPAPGTPIPPPTELGPVIPTMPPAPKTPDKFPDPVFPSPVPSPTPTPVMPPAPPTGNTSLPPIPVGPMGPPSVLPPTVDVTPKPPGGEPLGVGTPAAFTKPGGTTEVKPLVPESQPRTDFDVDLYEPKAGDTYEAISQEFYNDRRFAAVLRAFNQNQPLTGLRYVSIPPIHILRKRYPAQAGGVVPVGGSPSTGPNWGPAGGKSDPTPPPATANGRGTFIVPQGGMTLEMIARQTGVKWSDIWDLNPQHHPGTVLPAGTELKMPPTARLP